MAQMKTLGEKLYNLRRMRGLTQDKLAQLVGVSRQTIYKWEYDFIQPSSENITKLAEVLQIDANALLAYLYNEDTQDEIAIDTKEKNNTANRSRKSKNIFNWFAKHGICLSICLGIICIVLLCATIFVGITSKDSEQYDMIEYNYLLDSNVFIVLLIVTAMLSILESIIIILTIRGKILACKINNVR